MTPSPRTGGRMACGIERIRCRTSHVATAGWKLHFGCGRPTTRAAKQSSLASRATAVQLSDRRGRTITLTLSADRDADLAVEQLADAAARGIKLRTRALATTLFARLLVSDLFLHGIGGAKYDQVTDDIAERFFGLALPEFATASATLRLPIRHSTTGGDQLRAVRQQLRELNFHPERYLSTSGEKAAAAEVLAAKHRWIETREIHAKRSHAPRRHCRGQCFAAAVCSDAAHVIGKLACKYRAAPRHGRNSGLARVLILSVSA